MEADAQSIGGLTRSDQQGADLARVGAKVPDMAEILPFFTRVWMYASGVMFSVAVFAKGHPSWVGTVMNADPATVYLNLTRNALLRHNPAGMFADYNPSVRQCP